MTAEGSAAGDGRAVGVRCVTCDGVPGSPRNVGTECGSYCPVAGDGTPPGVVPAVVRLPGVMPGVVPGVVPGVLPGGRVSMEVPSENSMVAGDGGRPAGVMRVGCEKAVTADGVPVAAPAVESLGVGGGG